MEGILVLDKPSDFTSFDAVAVVRGLVRERSIGHTGTLDPMATGVLPLLLGRATKAAALLPDTDKAYTASFRFGESFDTGDITGTCVKTDSTAVSFEQLLAALPAFRGDILQVPPMYSAVSVDGQRLYKLARQGKTVERQPRPVTISSLELFDYDAKTRSGTLQISCSKGTYIRALIEDLAAAVSTCGVMTALRRTTACGFALSDAVSLDTLRAIKENGGDFSGVLRPVARLFDGLAAVRITAAQAVRFQNGGALDFSRCIAPRKIFAEGEHCALYCAEDFIGVAAFSAGTLQYVKCFSEVNHASDS